MNKKIILKSDSFTYPTKYEREEINNRIPKINRLNIDHKSALINFLKNKNINSAINEENIYWWNNCLNNRIGKLNETYIYVITHYERSDNKLTEKLLFDYYAEIFYYYFYSVRDIIGQLINVLFEIGLKEHEVFIKKSFIEKISNERLRKSFEEFANSTSSSYKKFRNGFNHRFTPNLKDNRVNNISNEKDENQNNISYTKGISQTEFYNDIIELINELSDFMENFDKFILEKNAF